MNKIITIIGFIISLFLYIEAPNHYSFTHTLLYLVLFLLFATIHTIRNFNGNYFSFDNFFLIGLLFANFIYPVFYYPIENRYFSLFALPFNEEVITRATSLSLLGSMSYFLGYSLYSGKAPGNTRLKLEPKKLSSKNGKVIIVTIGTFLLFLVTVGTSFLSGEYVGVANWRGISIYVFIVLVVLLYISIVVELFIKKDKRVKLFKFVFFHLDKKLLLLMASIVSIFLLIGDRGLPILIILGFLGTYSHVVNKINFRTFALAVFIGAIVLTVISFGRVSTTSDLSYLERLSDKMIINKTLDFGTDLTINNRSLYVIIDYVDKNDYLYGQNFIASIAAVIPFLQSLLVDLFALNPDKIGTAYFVTYLQLGSNSVWGLGTNLFAGIYLSFGSFGIILIMSYFGYFMAHTIYKSKSSLYWLLIYAIMMSVSIYLCRDDITSQFRTIVWSSVIYYTVYRLRLTYS